MDRLDRHGGDVLPASAPRRDALSGSCHRNGRDVADHTAVRRVLAAVRGCALSGGVLLTESASEEEVTMSDNRKPEKQETDANDLIRDYEESPAMEAEGIEGID